MDYSRKQERKLMIAYRYLFQCVLADEYLSKSVFRISMKTEYLCLECFSFQHSKVLYPIEEIDFLNHL